MIFRIDRVWSGWTTSSPAPIPEAFAEDNIWCIEINSIEELLALGKRVGKELIIQANESVPEITIYDGYRE